MAINLIGILLWAAVLRAEPNVGSHIWHGGDLVLGAYDGEVAIGVLSDRYKQMTANDQKASNGLRKLLELVRGSFPTGIHALPSLDPYINNNLPPFTLNVPLLSGSIDVKQIIINGLQDTQIKLLETRLNTVRTDFIFNVPVITGKITFRANLLIGSLFPITVEGTLRVKLENARILGAVSGVITDLPTNACYSLNALHARLLADNVKLSIDGLNFDKEVLDSLQSLDLFGSSVAIDPTKQVVNYYVASEVLKQLNNIVERFSIDQINAYLLAR